MISSWRQEPIVPSQPTDQLERAYRYIGVASRRRVFFFFFIFWVARYLHLLIFFFSWRTVWRRPVSVVRKKKKLSALKEIQEYKFTSVSLLLFRLVFNVQILGNEWQVEEDFKKKLNDDPLEMCGIERRGTLSADVFQIGNELISDSTIRHTSGTKWKWWWSLV